MRRAMMHPRTPPRYSESLLGSVVDSGLGPGTRTAFPRSGPVLAISTVAERAPPRNTQPGPYALCRARVWLAPSPPPTPLRVVW